MKRALAVSNQKKRRQNLSRVTTMEMCHPENRNIVPDVVGRERGLKQKQKSPRPSHRDLC